MSCKIAKNGHSHAETGGWNRRFHLDVFRAELNIQDSAICRSMTWDPFQCGPWWTSIQVGKIKLSRNTVCLTKNWKDNMIHANQHLMIPLKVPNSILKSDFQIDTWKVSRSKAEVSQPSRASTGTFRKREFQDGTSKLSVTSSSSQGDLVLLFSLEHAEPWTNCDAFTEGFV